MSASSAFVRTWKVGRYTATLSCPRLEAGAASCAVVEWEPEVPKQLAGAEMLAYVEGRDIALAEMAREFGIAIVGAEA